MVLPTTTKAYPKHRCCEPNFGRLSPLSCTGFPSISSAQFMILFLILQIFLSPSKSRKLTVCAHFCQLLLSFQRRRWVSHWMHSSTVTRSTSRLSTGERWECVEVNTVCCCWLYWYTDKTCGIPPLPKQLARCGLHQPNAATSLTETPVHQFHLTINLQHTVEQHYCTYRLQVYYKLELEAFHCQFLKYTKRFYITCDFRILDALWTVVPDLVHTRSLCDRLPYQNVWRKGEGCFVMYRAENWLFPRWLYSDTNIFRVLYIFRIVTTTSTWLKTNKTWLKFDMLFRI